MQHPHPASGAWHTRCDEQTSLEKCLQKLIRNRRSLIELLSVIQIGMRSIAPHASLILKGGAAFSCHLWGDTNTVACCLGRVDRIRDIDLELHVQPAAQNHNEDAIFAALCNAVDHLNYRFAPLVLASIRLPSTSRIVHSPPVCTRHWVGPEHVWCHGHRPGPIVAIRRGACHGNSEDFLLWRIALAVADAYGRIHYLPFVDISQHPHPDFMRSGLAASGALQPAARDIQQCAATHAKCEWRCEVFTLSVLQSDLRRMLVRESNLRPWLGIDSGKTVDRRTIVLGACGIGQLDDGSSQ